MSAEKLRQAAAWVKSDDCASDLEWAVAEWLEATAVRIDAGRDPKRGGRRNHGWRGSRQAMAVARAILRETS